MLIMCYPVHNPILPFSCLGYAFSAMYMAKKQFFRWLKGVPFLTGGNPSTVRICIERLRLIIWAAMRNSI